MQSQPNTTGTYREEFQAEIARRNRRDLNRLDKQDTRRWNVAKGIMVFLGGAAIVVLVLYLEMTRGGG